MATNAQYPYAVPARNSPGFGALTESLRCQQKGPYPDISSASTLLAAPNRNLLWLDALTRSSPVAHMGNIRIHYQLASLLGVVPSRDALPWQRNGQHLYRCAVSTRKFLDLVLSQKLSDDNYRGCIQTSPAHLSPLSVPTRSLLWLGALHELSRGVIRKVPPSGLVCHEPFGTQGISYRGIQIGMCIAGAAKQLVALGSRPRPPKKVPCS